MFNNIAGSKTISGLGTVLICTPPYPTIGTLTLDIVSSSFVGTAKIRSLGVNTPGGVTPRLTTFQKTDTIGDIAAGTAITMDMVHWVRMDGVAIYIEVSAYSSGSFTVYWSWSVG